MTTSPLLTYLMRQGDRSLVVSQRLLEYITHAPEIEEDLALSNIALDLIGQARVLYTYAGEIEGLGHDEDHFAYQREQHEFLSPLLCEQPNGDFAHIIMRQFLHDAFALAYWQAMTSSTDATLSALAGKTVKECTYHLRHSRSWVVRLGDGTDESRIRTQRAAERLWRYTGELFESDHIETELIASGVAADPDMLGPTWVHTVEQSFAEATLEVPASAMMATGGRSGAHGESFSYLIGELQVVARAHPGATW